MRRCVDKNDGMSGINIDIKNQQHLKIQEKLKHAPRSICFVVMTCYGFLSVRGFIHILALARKDRSNQNELDRDFLALVLVYLIEVLGAVVFGVSTLYRWSRRHFLEHHLPLVILFALTLSQNQKTQGRATSQHSEWMALVLLISFNEMTAALLAIWPNKNVDKLRVLPNMIIQFSLLLTETSSWFRATITQLFLRTDPSMWLTTLFSQFLLAAAVIHYSYLSKLSRIFVKLWLDKD